MTGKAVWWEEPSWFLWSLRPPASADLSSCPFATHCLCYLGELPSHSSHWSLVGSCSRSLGSFLWSACLLFSKFLPFLPLAFKKHRCTSNSIPPGLASLWCPRYRVALSGAVDGEGLGHCVVVSLPAYGCSMAQQGQLTPVPLLLARLSASCGASQSFSGTEG